MGPLERSGRPDGFEYGNEREPVVSKMSHFFNSGAADEEVDAEIDYYESLTLEQIDAELRRCGIDPGPTIEAVTRLVQEAEGKWRGRGSRPWV
jgi:hypothetical protein